MRNNLKNVAGVRHNAEMSRKRQSLLKKVLECVAFFIGHSLAMTGIFVGISKLLAWLGVGALTQFVVAAITAVAYAGIVLATTADDER